MKKRLLIVTREPGKLASLLPSLSTSDSVAVAGIAGSATSAVDECRRLKPDVVMIGMDLGESAWPALEGTRHACGLPTVMFGPPPDARTLKRALYSGAQDFLFEPLDPTEIQTVIGGISSATAIDPDNATQSDASLGKVVTIFGTKGGVGKSTIAANLAISAFVQSGKRGVIVDLDLEFGTLAALYGLKPNASIVDLCRTEGPIKVDIVQKVIVPVHTGIDLYLLPAPPTPDLAAEVEGEGRRVKARSYVTDILTSLRTSFDFVFVDTASNFRETNLAALDLSDLVLVISGPDIPTLQNTGKCLDILFELLNYPAEKVSIALNRADGGAGLTVGDMQEGLHHDIQFQVPSDGRSAIWCANCGRPLVLERPRSPMAEAINSMANTIVWQLSDAGAKNKPVRLDRRKSVLNWMIRKR